MQVAQEYMLHVDSLVVWAIVVCAICCYGTLLELCFFRNADERWSEVTQYWIEPTRILLSSLPLLGLLGTIVGLLKTFMSMSHGGFAQHDMFSGGLGEALFTTQLGLVLVVPGLLMHAYLKRRLALFILESSREINDRE